MSWIEKIKSKVSRPEDSDYLNEEGYTEPDYVPSKRSEFMAKLYDLPAKLFVLPFKSLLGLAHDSGVDVDYGQEKTAGEKIARIAKQVILLPFRLIVAPFEFIWAISRSGSKEILFVLPALFVCALWIFVFVKIAISGKTIEAKYYQRAIQSYRAGNYTEAKTYYKRLMQKQDVDPEQKFQWAIILGDTGQPEQALEMLEKLAPNDGIGYGPAHKLRAMAAVGELPNKANDPTVLERLHWHLKQSRDESPEMHQAWAAYYTHMSQFDKAIESLEKAAPSSPRAYELIARIHNGLGNEADEKQAFAQAAKAYKKIHDENPLDQAALIALASALTNLEQYQQAEQLLNKGMQQKATPQIKRATAAFYVRLYGVATDQKKPVSDRMNLLIRSLQLDPNFGPVYERMIHLYMRGDGNEEEKAKIKQSLMDVVTGDRPTPMAHLSLSNFLWEEGEKDNATFHLEQAYQMDKGFVVVMNNLAWMLAHVKEPDLNRALELSQQAVQQRPGDSRFRDTLGTILLKLGRHKEAIPELQLALNNNGPAERLSIHSKLAAAYREIGMEDLAKIHLKKGTPPQNK